MSKELEGKNYCCLVFLDVAQAFNEFQHNDFIYDTYDFTRSTVVHSVFTCRF